MEKVQQLQFWPAQKEFMAAGPQPTLFMGGVGSGKTYIGILKILYLLDLYPGSRAAIVRQRSTQLKSTTAKTLWKMLPRNLVARRNDNEGFVLLKNGSEIVMRHLDKENSIDDLKSLELNFAYVDQMEDISARAWDTLLERLGRWSGAMMRGGFPDDWPYQDRLGNKIPPKYALASAYSPGYDHWITSRFWERGEQREKYADAGYITCVGSTRDNLALSEDYIADRLSMGQEYVERFVDAVVWGANEGRIFDLLEDSIVEANPEFIQKILRSMKLHRVYDHGDTAPSACLWYATDSENNIFVYKEYMMGNQLISAHRENIWKLSCEDSPSRNDPPMYHSNYADPKIFTKDRGRKIDLGPTHSVADEWLDRRIMHNATAVAWRRANNNESVTINRVKEYLRIDPKHRNPFTGKIGSPHLFFIRRAPYYPYGCHEVLTDVRSAKRIISGYDNEGNKLWGDKRDETIRDHLLDCLRYGVSSRPSLGAGPADPEQEPGTISWHQYEQLMEQDENDQVRLGKIAYTGKYDSGY